MKVIIVGPRGGAVAIARHEDSHSLQEKGMPVRLFQLATAPPQNPQIETVRKILQNPEKFRKSIDWNQKPLSQKAIAFLRLAQEADDFLNPLAKVQNNSEKSLMREAIHPDHPISNHQVTAVKSQASFAIDLLVDNAILNMPPLKWSADEAVKKAKLTGCFQTDAPRSGKTLFNESHGISDLMYPNDEIDDYAQALKTRLEKLAGPDEKLLSTLQVMCTQTLQNHHSSGWLSQAVAERTGISSPLSISPPAAKLQSRAISKIDENTFAVEYDYEIFLKDPTRMEKGTELKKIRCRIEHRVEKNEAGDWKVSQPTWMNRSSTEDTLETKLGFFPAP